MSKNEGGSRDPPVADDDEIDPEEERKRRSRNDPLHIPEEKKNEKHKFWDTQPVTRLAEVPEDVGEIEASPGVDAVPAEPLKLPDAFEWVSVDVDNERELREVYELLRDNYVEDDDAMFRFDYQPEFLLWSLKPPGFKRVWHVGVRVKETRVIVGFISAIPIHMTVMNDTRMMVEINFLCVHKELRSKRLAPKLISEITRRVNREDIWQAVYTAGTLLPRPVGKCQYWHRSLNPEKLIAIGFSRIPRQFERFKKPMQMTKRLYDLSPETTLPLRPMELRHVPSMTRIFNEFLSRFKFHQIYSEEEVAHWFMPREKVVWTYVVENGSGEVTDFGSFYSLPSTVMRHEKHKMLMAAYSFYQVTSVNDVQVLVQDMLRLAKKAGFDVFNALEMMNSEDWLRPNKFGPGDGTLNFYLYNFRCPPLQSNQVGLIML